jgi:hypothetical protein
MGNGWSCSNPTITEVFNFGSDLREAEDAGRILSMLFKRFLLRYGT